MKKLLMSLIYLFLPYFLTAQDLPAKTLSVDTIAGHGYKVIFITSPVMKKVFAKKGFFNTTIDNEFYREKEYTWVQSQRLIDSMSKLGYSLPKINELKTIFNITQKNLDTRRILIGSYEWIGINNFYWCCNSPSLNIENVYACGSLNSKDFIKKELYGKSLVNDEGNFEGKEKNKILFLIKY